jgi:putative oxidoreductase
MPSAFRAAPTGSLASTASFDQAAAASLLIRLFLGAMWLSHALLKLIVFTPAGTSAFFESVGLPGWITWPAILAELAGGALIIAGWRGRVVSVLLLPILLGAAWIHWPNGWVFNAKGGGWEYPVFLAAMSLVHALIGDGRYSVGAVLRREN